MPSPSLSSHFKQVTKTSVQTAHMLSVLGLDLNPQPRGHLQTTQHLLAFVSHFSGKEGRIDSLSCCSSSGISVDLLNILLLFSAASSRSPEFTCLERSRVCFPLVPFSPALSSALCFGHVQVGFWVLAEL